MCVHIYMSIALRGFKELVGILPRDDLTSLTTTIHHVLVHRMQTFQPWSPVKTLEIDTLITFLKKKTTELVLLVDFQSLCVTSQIWSQQSAH